MQVLVLIDLSNRPVLVAIEKVNQGLTKPFLTFLKLVCKPFFFCNYNIEDLRVPHLYIELLKFRCLS